MDRPTFLATFGPFADKWSAQTGIPSSVFLAIIASESNWGEAPTLFGIKGSGTAGSVNLPTTEVINGQRVQVNDNFAANRTVDDAFRQFIDLISQGRYKDAWDAFQQTGDANALLTGLNQAGYATDPSWGDFISRLAGELGGTAPPQQALRGGAGGQLPMTTGNTQGLPQGAQMIGEGLARWKDPDTGDYIYFKYNASQQVNLITGEIQPAGWAPTGTLPQPVAQKPETEKPKNIRVNQTTGLAYKVDDQGNVVGRAPEFDEAPKQPEQPKESPAAQAARERARLTAAQNEAIATARGGGGTQGQTQGQTQGTGTTTTQLPPPAAGSRDLMAPMTLTGIDPFTGANSYQGINMPLPYTNNLGQTGISTQTFTNQNVRDILQQMGLPSTGNPQTDFSTLQGGQQTRSLLGPFAPDLAAIQQQEQLHRVPKGTYKAALGQFTGMANAALQPTLPSLLSTLPDPYDLYSTDQGEIPQGFAGGGTVYTGVTDPLYAQQQIDAANTPDQSGPVGAARTGQGVGARNYGVPFTPEQLAEIGPTNQLAIPRERTGLSSYGGLRPVTPGVPRPQLTDFSNDITTYPQTTGLSYQLGLLSRERNPFLRASTLAAMGEQARREAYDQAINNYYGITSPLDAYTGPFAAQVRAAAQQAVGNLLNTAGLHMAGGGSMVTPGPQALVDMRTGQTNAVMGEAGPERLDVTPLTPRPQDITLGREQQAAATPFALLVEQLFAGKRKGRVPPLRPVGATMGG